MVLESMASKDPRSSQSTESLVTIRAVASGTEGLTREVSGIGTSGGDGAEPRATMVQVLRHRAEREPDAEAFTFLEEDGRERLITYAELDAQARAIAGSIQRSGAGPGERVLLVYPPGLDYVTALFG